MPVDFASEKHNRRTVQVPFGDDILNVTYVPSEWNEDMIEDEREMTMQGKQLRGQARSLARLIAEWDAYRGDELIPVTEDEITALGPAFTDPVYRAIWVDVLPDAKAAMSNGSESGQPTDITQYTGDKKTGKKTTGKKRGRANAN